MDLKKCIESADVAEKKRVYPDHLTPPTVSLTGTRIQRGSRADAHHVHDQVSTGIALVCRLLETGVLQHTGETEFCMPETAHGLQSDKSWGFI